MKKICSKNLQRQITSLIPIIELYISLISEVEHTQDKLNILPNELDIIKKHLNLLNLFSAHKSEDDLELHLQQTEFKLDSLVDDLDAVSINLVAFECKLKNIIALKERLEALQAERINGLTPERIYKLLEKQKQREQSMPLSSLPPNDNQLRIEKQNTYWQKIVNLGKKFRDRKTAVSLAIMASLFLGWTAGYHSSVNVQLNDNQTVEATKKNNSSVDI